MISTTQIEEIDDNFNPLSQHLTSEIIRSRLLKENVAFFSNDNIADHIEWGEIEDLETEVDGRIRDLLKSLIIDIDQGLRLLAKRVSYQSWKLVKLVKLYIYRRITSETF